MAARGAQIAILGEGTRAKTTRRITWRFFLCLFLLFVRVGGCGRGGTVPKSCQAAGGVYVSGLGPRRRTKEPQRWLRKSWGFSCKPFGGSLEEGMTKCPSPGAKAVATA